MKHALRVAFVLAAALPCFADSLPNALLPAPYGVFYDFSLNNSPSSLPYWDFLGLDIRAIVPNYLQPGSYDLTSDVLFFNVIGSSPYQLVDYSLLVGANDPLYTPTLEVRNVQSGVLSTYSYAFTDGAESHVGNVSSGLGLAIQSGNQYQFDYSLAPEPSTWMLLLFGVPVLLLFLRRRRVRQVATP